MGLGGSKSKNSMGDHFLSQNEDLTGDRHPIPQLGVCYANNPKSGGAIRRPRLRTADVRGFHCAGAVVQGSHTGQQQTWVGPTEQQGPAMAQFPGHRAYPETDWRENHLKETPLPITVTHMGGFGMTPWCDDLVCSWRRLLADRHSLPFPWTLSLHRRWCPSASHHPGARGGGGGGGEPPGQGIEAMHVCLFLVL